MFSFCYYCVRNILFETKRANEIQPTFVTLSSDNIKQSQNNKKYSQLIWNKVFFCYRELKQINSTKYAVSILRISHEDLGIFITTILYSLKLFNNPRIFVHVSQWCRGDYVLSSLSQLFSTNIAIGGLAKSNILSHIDDDVPGCDVHRVWCIQTVMYTDCDVHGLWCAHTVMYTDCDVHRLWCTQTVMYTDYDVHRLWCTRIVMYSNFNVHRIINSLPWCTQNVMYTTVDHTIVSSNTKPNHKFWIDVSLYRSRNRHPQ